MKYYLEPEKQIPIKEEVDVLVVGGGPAGFSAAYNAARQGVRTMLVEQSGNLGGVATTGLMSHWTGNTRGGFYEELLDRSQDINDKEVDSNNTLRDNERGVNKRQIINPEKLKKVMLDMLDEVGVELQLYTFASAAIKEGSRLIGVITESKSGREAIIAKNIIDASGDGDIAAKAGAKYVKGRESDGKMQPMTLMFKVAGVDTERVEYVGGFEDSYEIEAGDLQTVASNELPSPAGHVLIYPTTIPGVVTLNMTNCTEVDGTKAEDLTKAEKVCRSQMTPILDFLKKHLPGFENSFIISSASIIGVRETRHFVGEYCLTEQDILTARVFDDWVVSKAHFNFDVHNINGSGLDETGAQKHFSQTEGYTIPYRCFLPEKIDNLLLVGRNISGTHLAHSNFRVMPICVNMGQAVGIAAAIAIKEGIKPRDVKPAKIQDELKRQGVSL